MCTESIYLRLDLLARLMFTVPFGALPNVNLFRRWNHKITHAYSLGSERSIGPTVSAKVSLFRQGQGGESGASVSATVLSFKRHSTL